jgi:hypothetical protein
MHAGLVKLPANVNLGIQQKDKTPLARGVLVRRGGKRFVSISGGNQKLREGIGKLL